MNKAESFLKLRYSVTIINKSDVILIALLYARYLEKPIYFQDKCKHCDGKNLKCWLLYCIALLPFGFSPFKYNKVLTQFILVGVSPGCMNQKAVVNFIRFLASVVLLFSVLTLLHKVYNFSISVSTQVSNYTVGLYVVEVLGIRVRHK